MFGILAGAMSGAGEAGVGAARQYGEHLSKSALQEREAQIQDARARMLSELTEGREIRGEERRRAEAAQVGAEAEAARGGMKDDLSGTMQPLDPMEGARAAAGVYGKRGFLAESMREKESADRIESDRAKRAHETATLAETSRFHREQSERDTQQHTERMEGLKKQLTLAERQLARTPDPDVKIVQDDEGEFIRLNTKTGEQKKLGFKGPKDITESDKLLLGAKVKAAHDERVERSKLDKQSPTYADDYKAMTAGIERLEREIESFRRKKPAASSDAPYPDGTRLKGRDGKVYVVQGGQPVLEGSAGATPDPLEEGDRNPMGFDQPPPPKEDSKKVDETLRRRMGIFRPSYNERFGQGL